MHVKCLLQVLVVAAATGAAVAQAQVKVLHAFGTGTDGGGLWSNVVFDPQGNLYGTTSGGGTHGEGTVYELTPQPDGEWTESILYNFCSALYCDDGAMAFGGPVLDGAGNVYGNTHAGGGYHAGAAFELTPSPDGWAYGVIYNLGGPDDPACCPWGSPTIDQRGDLYGAGYAAFELSPGAEGWAESTLHVFTGQNGDGSGPQAGPIMDAAGNLYGTTAYGGGSSKCTFGCGTVYELQPVQVSPGGGWREQILHRFGYSAQDGRGGPGLGQLAMDREGNLYGTAGGGVTGYGTAYKLTRPVTSSGNAWQETILYSFVGDAWGSSGVIFGADGNLYGTAINGGGYACGAVYKLSRPSTTVDGTWQFTLLHSFTGADGCQPDANLTLGPDGNLYGTTATGGAGGAGVVFEIVP